MMWVVRIGVTIFTLPFFVVGASLAFGGGFLGGFGWFGTLFGIAFMAVPAMMLIFIWSAKPGKPAKAPQPAPITPPTPPMPQKVSCTYCGRPRPASAVDCPSCGAH